MSDTITEFAEGIVAPQDRTEFIEQRARKGNGKSFFDYLKKPIREVPPPPSWMVKPKKPLQYREDNG